jgi:hypothetical protein
MWNYRVIQHKPLGPDDEEWLGIHEAHYRDDSDDHPHSYTVNPPGVSSTDGVAGLRWQIERMLIGVGKPILTEEDFPTNDPTQHF